MSEKRRFHAQMLLERNHTGDRIRGRELLGGSVDGYRRSSMRRHAEMAAATLDERSS